MNQAARALSSSPSCRYLFFLLCIRFIGPGSFLCIPPQENALLSYLSLFCARSSHNMQRIADDPTRATCPSFEDPVWEFLRRTLVDAHQGDQPLTMEEAAQQMKDAWARENQLKVDAWNIQLQQDAAEREGRERVTREAEEEQQARQAAEAEEARKESDKKKPKLLPFDPERQIEEWVEARPASYAINKLNNLEYVELDYFTPKSCKEASADVNRSVSHDALTFTQQGDTFAIRPLAGMRPSKHIRCDEELGWEEMMDAKNIMLHFMAKSGLWPDEHAVSIATLYMNLDCHPRKGQKNGKAALILYQSRARREWFEALKRGEGFNLALIRDEYLRSLAEEVNSTIQERENAIRDRDIEQVGAPLSKTK